MAETLLEKAEAAKERLLKGEGTDEDYATVAEVSAAAITMQKSAKSDDGDADADDAPGATAADEDDDDDAGDDEDDEDVEKSLRVEADDDDEDAGDMFKAMVAAAELAGADDPEEFIQADEILKGIGSGLDTIVGMLKGLDKRLTRIETFQKSLSAPPAPAAAAPAKTESPEVEAIRKSQAATAANLDRMIQEVEGLKDFLGNRPASPHPSPLGKSAGTSAGTARAGVDALDMEVCLDILGKAADAKAITTDEAARACDLIGARRDLPPAEVIRKAAPGAMPMLKSLVEAQL